MSHSSTARFPVIVGFLLPLVGQGAGALESVNWNAVGNSSSFGGSWSYGTVTGSSAAIPGSGSSFSVNWSGMPYGAGYTTSISEAVGLGAPDLGAATQTFAFGSTVSGLTLWFAWVDNGTSFDFGSYDWTLLGSNSASRSGSSVVISGSQDRQQDGFVVQINEIFGTGRNLAFTFNNPVNNPSDIGHTVGFTMAAAASPVPEPSTYGIILGGAVLALAVVRRRRAA